MNRRRRSGVGERVLALAIVPAIAMGALGPSGAMAETVSDDGIGAWFRNAEQRAAARLRAGDHEGLATTAPDARWEAHGRYGAGDHAGAAEAFARAADERDHQPEALDALRFGQATALTRDGRFDEALSLYEQILARDPDHADARHNRDIARALAELAARESQRAPSADAEGEQTEPSSSQDAGQQSGQGDRQDEQGENGSGADGANPTERGPTERGPTERDAGSERDAEQAAREALEAGRGEETGEGADAAAGEERGVGAAYAPSEGEQATEQWLRRIDDDPAGLLRRRLQQTHQDDYPEVGDGAEPW